MHQVCTTGFEKSSYKLWVIGRTSFIDNHHSKAVVHTFLAWQDEPGMPLGQAITAKALDGNKPLAHNFSEFLKNLFKKI